MASQALRKTCSVRSSASGWLPVRKYRYLYTRSTKRSYNSPNALASRETTTRLTSATTAGSSGPSMFWDGSAPGIDNALESSFVMAVAGARSRSPSTPFFDASSGALPTPRAVRAPTRRTRLKACAACRDRSGHLGDGATRLARCEGGIHADQDDSNAHRGEHAQDADEVTSRRCDRVAIRVIEQPGTAGQRQARLGQLRGRPRRKRTGGGLVVGIALH